MSACSAHFDRAILCALVIVATACALVGCGSRCPRGSRCQSHGPCRLEYAELPMRITFLPGSAVIDDEDLVAISEAVRAAAAQPGFYRLSAHVGGCEQFVPFQNATPLAQERVNDTMSAIRAVVGDDPRYAYGALRPCADELPDQAVFGVSFLVPDPGHELSECH